MKVVFIAGTLVAALLFVVGYRKTGTIVAAFCIVGGMIIG